MELQGQNIVIFDAEIKNVIDMKKITWNDKHLMGVSVAVAFHFLTMEYKVFMDDNLPELVDLLNNADVTSGFNTLGFDIPLFNSTKECGGKVREDNNYDILYWSRRATGWTPSMKFPSNMRLDNHLKGTFGDHFVKTEDGANAPVFWQEGKIGRVVSYCIADVHRERMLFEHIWNTGTVKTDTFGERQIFKPQTFLENLKRGSQSK